MKSLGSTIKDARLKKRLTLRAFAQRIEVSPAHQSAIEQDRCVPAREVIERTATALDLDPDALCGLVGKLTAEVERKLSKLARRDPSFFRTMVDRIGGAS